MLSMLGHADYIRRLFLGKLFEILEMDENQRESSDPDIGTLSEAEHERIERFADDMGMGMRKLYREAVVGWSLYVSSPRSHSLRRRNRTLCSMYMRHGR